MKTIICDLDGTLALIEHRRHLVTGEHKNWDAFYKACVDDEPNWPVIETVLGLYGRFDLYAKTELVIFSGREESVRGETIEWLRNYDIYPDLLIMRPVKDYTPDDVLKKKWLYEFVEKDQVFCVFDDRQKVVDMWRAEGLTCFQVAAGNF